VFDVKPGRCMVEEQSVELKVEVDWQLGERVESGFLSNSNSAWAHPIDCGAKTDKVMKVLVNDNDGLCSVPNATNSKENEVFEVH
jgi:hypothetical protein